jgi:hypothetical protein
MEAEAHPLYGKSLGFLTGTTTQAAPGIAKRSALVPTGMLLKEHEAPICGEVASGISKRGINQKHLSFVEADFYPTALEYALNQNFVFSKEKALSELSESMRSFLLQKPHKSTMDLLICLKLKLIRATLYADLPKESISIIKAEIKAALSTKDFDEECRHFIENDILTCIDALSSKVISPKELELIYGKAHPLIFGISTLTDEIADKIKVVRGVDIRGETSIEGPLKLGEHIDFMIVADESFEIVKELFEDKVPYPILSYQAALYLLAKAPKTY